MAYRRKDLIIYIFLDWFAAAVAWFCLFVIRKRFEFDQFAWDQILDDPNLYRGILIIPACWIVAYYLWEHYRDIYRLSRFRIFTQTLMLSVAGNLALFFTILSDDLSLQYTGNLRAFVYLFVMHFGITIIFRLAWLTHLGRCLKNGVVTYITLIVGGNKKAREMYRNISVHPYRMGHHFIGYISAGSDSGANDHSEKVSGYLPCLGGLEDLRRVVSEREVEETIIAVDTTDHHRINSILNVLLEFSDQMLIKLVPDLFDILSGQVRMDHVYGAPLIEIKRDPMPRWQRFTKRILDFAVSIILLIILSPVILICLVKVRLSSKGPLFFRQERVGKNGRVFYIFKFRSMYVNSEADGPQLSFDNDPRCTPWGAFMRKWRLDEIPQLVNVIRAEMSIVGPRPERQHYINQILAKAPHYNQLLRVRPGITSWGQVKYGYASDLDQMLDRLKFDLLYIENMSLMLDLKILIYTVLVLFQGKGK